MVERYRDGALPAPASSTGARRGADDGCRATADAAIDRLDFQAALAAIMGFVRTVNGYVTEREPWKLAKDPAQRARRSTTCSTRPPMRCAASRCC